MKFMLTPDALERIEEQAMEKFASEGMSSKINDDHLTGDIPERVDVDRYRYVAAECTLPEDVIKEWLYGDFVTVVEKYLKSQGVSDIRDLVSEEDISSPFTYFDACMDVCQEAEYYFWDEEYPELQQQYFEEHAEKIY